MSERIKVTTQGGELVELQEYYVGLDEEAVFVPVEYATTADEALKLYADISGDEYVAEEMTARRGKVKLHNKSIDEISNEEMDSQDDFLGERDVWILE